MPDALPLFDLDHYKAMGLDDSGAKKLRSSAVAPLVAKARGYVWVPVGTAESYKQAAADLRLGSMRSGPGALLKDLAGQGGTLVMPLYRISTVREASADNTIPAADEVQFRPEKPRTNEQGKPIKYQFAKGSRIPADVHPSLPREWMTNPVAVVISEGTIKIDSALTAICRHHGVEDEVLCDTSDGATERLREILTELPIAARHLLVSFAGVGNWHNNPELADLPIGDRTVWVAFDKDVDVNWQVWDQARKLSDYITNRKGTPVLVDLGVTETDIDGRPIDVRAGLDDFLAEHGTWDDLGGRLSSELPPRPEQTTETKIGDWRVNEDEFCTEEFVQTVDELGNKTGGRWERRVGIAGRVTKTIDQRTTTRREDETGKLETGITEGVEQTSELELVWQRPHEDEPRETHLQVPAPVLGIRPESWERHLTIPANLARHPEWPPKPEWLAAIKGHREDEHEQTTSFTNMGWVPTAEEGQRFLIGDQCVGPNGLDEAAIPGCTDHILAQASSFGVIIPNDDDDLRQCMTDVIEKLVLADVFTQSGLAELVIGTALRPVIPLYVHTPVLFSGPRRVGKSWTAAAIMSFWQRLAGTWTENNLPGSVKDTRAANENTQARSIIWVFDDLAPSADRRQAEAEEAALENVVRSCHNGSFKRRMSRDMKATTVLRPRALPIITAENSLTVSSVMDRCIHYKFRSGSLGSREATDEFVLIRDYSGSPSVVTGGALEWMARQNIELGFAKVRDRWLELLDDSENQAIRELSSDGKATRHAKMAADIYLGLRLFAFLLKDLGMTDEYLLMNDRALRFFDIPRQHYTDQAATTPGAALLEALRSVLSSGSGYIADAHGGGAPRLPDRFKDARFTASMFGWTINNDEPPRTRGEQVGYFAEVRGTHYLLFDAQAAFRLAKMKFPSLIPAGSRSTTAWSSMWDEGLAGGHWTRPSDSVTVKVGASRDTPVAMRGVPVPLSLFIGEDEGGIDDDSYIDPVNGPVTNPDFD